MDGYAYVDGMMQLTAIVIKTAILKYNNLNMLMESILPCYLQEGGPIGLVRDGDIITIDAQERRIDVDVTDQEMEERRKNWSPPPYKATRGVLFKVKKNRLW